MLILKKIKQFDPEPYYVNYFFNSYLFSVNKIYVRIFEDVNKDFGLFITGKSSKLDIDGNEDVEILHPLKFTFL